MAAFVIYPFFLEKIAPAGPVTCPVAAKCYEALLKNHVLLALQQRQCVRSYNIHARFCFTAHSTLVKQRLIPHFGDDIAINHHFPTAASPRSPDLIPCDF
ncbi:uncharacterized protein TNCV_965851 [Trichonephila clavipes]|nr:uncharacterized protein TNCV_965851 [Trichonephila clavipes]